MGSSHSRSLANLEVIPRRLSRQLVEVDVLQVPQPGAELRVLREVVVFADGCDLHAVWGLEEMCCMLVSAAHHLLRGMRVGDTGRAMHKQSTPACADIILPRCDTLSDVPHLKVWCRQ